ncbi:MAG: hypothetical protein PHQ58_05185 [Rhodoferax sp.]|uniref:hypothetical protein n=1 Tax=Rhodoferax sp. TaxID=50421 RepID=UPI00260BDE0C|nr:hypothetical protein [Rhodoferax sp.]MDD2879809.1 hypothetical protein [Rhodoferax sp.]
MSATIIKASAKGIMAALAAKSVNAASVDAALAVASAIEALVGCELDIGVGEAQGFVVLNFPVEANRHGGLPHLVDTLCPAAGWQGKAIVVDGVTWVEILMQQVETPAAVPQPVAVPAATAAAAPAVPMKPIAPAVPAAQAAPTIPAAATGAIEQLLAQLTKSVESVSGVIAAASSERNALLAATQAALAQRQECDKALTALSAQVEVAKQATAAAQTAAQAAVAALAAKAAAPAAAPAAKADWMDSTPVKIGLGVAAAGVVVGAGYFAYTKFFGNNAE